MRIVKMERSKNLRKCPRCGSKDVFLEDSYDDGVNLYICNDCNHEFEVSGFRAKSYSRDYDYENDSEDDYSGNKWDR